MRGEQDHEQGGQEKPREVIEEEPGRGAESGREPPREGLRIEGTPGARREGESAKGQREGPGRADRGGVESREQVEQHGEGGGRAGTREGCDQMVEGEGGEHGQDRPEQGRAERTRPGPAGAERRAHGGAAGTVEVGHRGRVPAKGEVGAGRREVLRREPEPAHDGDQGEQSEEKEARVHAVRINSGCPAASRGTRRGANRRQIHA